MRQWSGMLGASGIIDEAGMPFVSMVAYAVEPQLHCVVIHESGLAAHTRNRQARDRVSLMVMQSEVAGESVHGQTDACNIR
jgi:putative heme iron utilization protein